MFPLDYHQRTKHHFNRFARSLGYLDWSTQPDPFRRYAGAPAVELPRAAVAGDVPYGALYDARVSPSPMTDLTIGEWLRCSMGLSAWKQYGASRWALRVNPSSGNLHPTEAYIVRDGRVCHYAPREHALEERCILPSAAWEAFSGGRPGFVAALTSILWREAWKYGERSFRYCQHDLGHAIAALRLAASLLGWRLALLPRWSDAQVAAVLGIDRDPDFADAEREEPECIAVVTPDDAGPWVASDPQTLAGAAPAASWQGVANRLSAARVDWPIIAEVAEATRYPGGAIGPGSSEDSAGSAGSTGSGRSTGSGNSPGESARSIILRRRSAVAFDGRSALSHTALLAMLARLDPASPPFDALPWPAHVHLAMFLHRVDGLPPGLYAYLRTDDAFDEWRAAMRQDFLWEKVSDPGHARESAGLFLLAPLDVAWPANRVSCDQDIAADGFFSLGMVARLEQPLHQYGEWFYRRLFWECGVIGQVLYLEAEAAGARSTGIGCFYDDPVHDVFGFAGPAWQSLYHFSMGIPVEDTRLTTEPGYPWE